MSNKLEVVTRYLQAAAELELPDSWPSSVRYELSRLMAGSDLAYTLEYGSLDNVQRLDWRFDNHGTMFAASAKFNRTWVGFELSD